MMEYTSKQLEKWDKKITDIAKSEGLDWYPQEYEICNYEDMICYEAYVGMPSHYSHWSYGKAYERKKTLYRYNLEGLPYEMVINSNPCIAYLMRDNTLLLQILTMAHVYGHNDFFKNNRLFAEGTKADYTIEMFKNHADRIRNYIEDPTIGYEKVERILDAAHAIRYHTRRFIGLKELSREEKKKRMLDKYYDDLKSTGPLDDKKEITFPCINKIPLEPTDDIMSFLIEYSDLKNWEKDIIHIVNEETKYFIPQIETKIMNEGWASHWHYKILSQLELPQGLYMEFLNRHNQIIRPFYGRINPYYLGFKIFEDIEKKYGKEKIFEVRRLERDQSFIRKYFTEELAVEMNIFQYNKKGNNYIIEEIADKKGWKKLRDTLANTVGIGGIPYIKVEEILPRNKSLVLIHEYDGRELELNYAYETLKYLVDLWGRKVLLKTTVNNSQKTIVCNDDKTITMTGG
ncbi:SpoVR family protein [Paramaledivibacter caminithermalis]|jgi:stage V sporulation protein R|uniref:Stage V sporulation protein R n=1 Tax=Paramaledivibacter caminithermalis (strain DSM 15212 / CIP 107654 / DViRD3) TaxID=1121301 RepID=A0A1M6LZ55_PARC5|nr:SpoVR family protein [Paramaledivibacter caminithermalis]SHJ76529.1 stage V sporulation protein R [Paramaledivibacter caminithermalis DSM 15212]